MELKDVNTLGFDHIYVINLPKRTDRREQIQSELTSLGFEYSFIQNPVDGHILDINILLEQGIANPYFIDPVGILTNGMYGCALSHYNTWKEFLESSYSYLFTISLYKSK